MSVRPILKTLSLATALALPLATWMAAGANAQTGLNVVTSIKPVHSLVASVMQGVGEPSLLVEGNASPHSYSLKPSQARALQDADLVFWIGEALETFLEGPVETIGENARAIELARTDGLALLELREGGAFEAHDHGDHDTHAHGEDDHHDHDHDDKHAHDDDGHDHDDHAHDDDHHGHDHDDKHETRAEDHHGHDHGAFDAHVWLDPQNAVLMADAIARALAKADPANAATYRANAEALQGRLADLVTRVGEEVAPARDKGFIVFHDAYRYFEERFGLAATGAITVTPDVMPGAERIQEIRAAIAELDAACVFAEPQFEPKLVEVVIEGTGARSGVLDPLGAGIEAGPDHYFDLIGNMATAFRTCLAPQS